MFSLNFVMIVLVWGKMIHKQIYTYLFLELDNYYGINQNIKVDNKNLRPME